MLNRSLRKKYALIDPWLTPETRDKASCKVLWRVRTKDHMINSSPDMNSLEETHVIEFDRRESYRHCIRNPLEANMNYQYGKGDWLLVIRNGNWSTQTENTESLLSIEPAIRLIRSRLTFSYPSFFKIVLKITDSTYTHTRLLISFSWCMEVLTRLQVVIFEVELTEYL